MAGLPPGRPSSQASMMAGGRFLLRRPIGAFIHLGGGLAGVEMLAIPTWARAMTPSRYLK